MDNLGYLLNKVSVMTKTELTNQLKEYKVTAQQWARFKGYFASSNWNNTCYDCRKIIC